MKKVVNVFEEKAEGLETNKRITKNVSENIHKVDSIISSARSSSSLFNIQAISARFRLRDACERAILAGSTSFTQRMEEILWRKVYYDPLSAAKKMRKDSSWSELEGGLIWAHLNDGIAYYHHYLMNLASSASNTIQYTADLIPFSYHDDSPQPTKSTSSNPEPCLHDSLFRSLTCLGDLARYMLDIPSQISSSSAYLLSVRYYHQALHYNCEGGLTHSNLATVYSTNNQPLLAAVHYLRAITCEKPFEAAENNLRRMLDKSRMWLENKKMEKEAAGKESNIEEQSTLFLHTCLALISCFVNNRRMEEVAVLCQEVLVQLGKLLDEYDNVEPPDLSEGSSDAPAPAPAALTFKGLNGCVDAPLSLKASSEGSSAKKKGEEESGSLFLLTPESMVTLCALFIICVKRLKMQGSPHSSMSEVLLVSILLTLVSHINTRLEQRFSLVDPTFVLKLLPPPPEMPPKKEEAEKDMEESGLCNGDKSKRSKGKRNKLSKLRRRRMKRDDGGGAGGGGGPDDDSEGEENEFEEDSNDSCHDLEGTSSSSDEAEEDFDPSTLCSSEDEDSDNDVKVESSEEWEGITEEEHLELVEAEGMLGAVNVTLQWLFRNPDMIKMCGETAHNLWTSTAKLFNLVRVDYEKLNTDDTSAPKKQMLTILKMLNKESFTFKDDFNQSIGSLPENLMLHLVIPSFERPSSMHSLKPAEMNLLRLYRLNSIMYQLCTRDDTPLKLKDERYVSCEEKIKCIADKAKIESEKSSEGRSTPSSAVPPASNGVPKADDPSPLCSTKPEEPSSSVSTPKRSSSSHPAASARVTSSMQSLTAQWLQHEVRNLEEKTSRRTKLGGLYLVPDASVLISHLPAIKQMLASPSHMVIIPQVVIDSLDQQKRESLGARDAIRWLEVKLRQGSRFIRAQRPHEKTRLPLIKYPKRKDKDAWEWFHVAECCCYLGAQMNKSESKTSTVTLLTTETSSKLAKRSFSLHTLAEAAGATLQSVEEFVRKWQISTKGHS